MAHVIRQHNGSLPVDSGVQIYMEQMQLSHYLQIYMWIIKLGTAHFSILISYYSCLLVLFKQLV